MDRQTLTDMLARVSRREMQVPDAVEAIIGASEQVAETSAPQPDINPVPQAERSGPPEGMLTTANAMETPRNGAPDVPEQTEEDVPDDPFGDEDDEVGFEADEGLLRSLNPDFNEEA